MEFLNEEKTFWSEETIATRLPIDREFLAELRKIRFIEYYKYRVESTCKDIFDKICCLIWQILESDLLKKGDKKAAKYYTKKLSDKLGIDYRSLINFQKLVLII